MALDVSPDGEHVPRWAQLLQESICAAQQQSQELRDTLLSIQQGAQQAKNRGLKNNKEKLTPVIRLLDGTVPANLALITSDIPTTECLLRFYGLPNNGTLFEKEARLKEFFGINL